MKKKASGKNPRKASGTPESSREEVVRGDAAPMEQEEDLGADEAIRARAYALYLQRGGDRAGDDMNDWLQAEREYRERRGLSDNTEIRE